MVEGRISAGVVVGADSDIGGGASIMGTLSGGGKEVVSIGSGCLLGRQLRRRHLPRRRLRGRGRLLRDRGLPGHLPDGSVVKARELSGRDGLLFRRNSVSGALEALPRNGDWGALNAALHTN